MKKFKVQKRNKHWRAKRLVRNNIGYMRYRNVTTSDCYGKDDSCILWFNTKEETVQYLKERYNAKEEQIKYEL